MFLKTGFPLGACGGDGIFDEVVRRAGENEIALAGIGGGFEDEDVGSGSGGAEEDGRVELGEGLVELGGYVFLFGGREAWVGARRTVDHVSGVDEDGGEICEG